ncbi:MULTISPECIES: RbsD/FucU domain-containing protein [Streptomyces]|uniref:RbsD/FucU domain-containing protein n=1 Tax=Streptomyces scabiei TaxID=1930 RepID=UPI0004E773B4|nr:MULTISPECIES: RbsD/FucU domain-containing protein [Streptomyces]MBP5863605.1 D-ribose pyranase [Streptomyces sp. LBUM 1484]MBP5906044.1 D-ribose pyranase [Streptomyces sp. LBUM 1478]MBP5931402.1 D-ribose pyranase [Streptomyces sp. LBUM 1479]KFG03209.1 ribose ABC transporter [Streptomyces scabiei]MBP5875891.1 D-ribose pyranase [Streptomyces sp. LBUM 1477]
MKRSGTLNRQPAGAVAESGHGHGVPVCDAGMPVPDGPRLVGLAFRAGVPSFAEVLEDRFPDLEPVTHETLKEPAAGARLIVRTGEARPYANVLLRCGVFF